MSHDHAHPNLAKCQTVVSQQIGAEEARRNIWDQCKSSCPFYSGSFMPPSEGACVENSAGCSGLRLTENEKIRLGIMAADVQRALRASHRFYVDLGI